MSFRALRASALLALGLVAFACRRSAPDVAPAPGAAAGAGAVVEILKGGRWLFTYVDADGTFSTTDKPETIPEASRAMVRVFDPSDPSSKTNAPGQVYVANVNELLKSGKTPAKALSREAYETAALAQLPPGESSPRSAQRAQPAPIPPLPGGEPAPPKLAPGEKPVVTIYGTSWCGACRAARQYFTEKKVPFADKDVENDAAAARELADKASKLGIPTDRVPVIDVRGRLLLGFDRARIEALLGEST